MRFLVFILFPLLFLAGCATGEYKGEIAYITNVPRRIVEREVGFLTDRINSWARQVDHSDNMQGTADKPWQNDEGFSIRHRITLGKRVLAMLGDKLRYGGSTIDFTRKEWGRAARVYCRLDPDPGSSVGRP